MVNMALLNPLLEVRMISKGYKGQMVDFIWDCCQHRQGPNTVPGKSNATPG